MDFDVFMESIRDYSLGRQAALLAQRQRRHDYSQRQLCYKWKEVGIGGVGVIGGLGRLVLFGRARMGIAFGTEGNSDVPVYAKLQKVDRDQYRWENVVKR